jgi:hypothetical protein
MNRDVCEHFNPVDLPCDKCEPTALRLADECDEGMVDFGQAATELRRLHEANEAFGKRQEWWNERMFVLEQQRDALITALHNISLASQDSGSTREGMGLYARAAIKKAEENT